MATGVYPNRIFIFIIISELNSVCAVIKIYFNTFPSGIPGPNDITVVIDLWAIPFSGVVIVGNLGGGSTVIKKYLPIMPYNMSAGVNQMASVR
jgi:hypothetical protein